jgi:3-oxoacyl-(acyl-carrier-protein) synthase
MRGAIACAGLTPDDIDHINAHGTATRPNDLTEAQAIHDIFGPRAEALPVTANKGALGHMLGAAGGIEAIASVLSLRHGLIPPTANFATPDPEARVALVAGQPREAALRHVLSNSAGFGGCNAALLFTKV